MSGDKSFVLQYRNEKWTNTTKMNSEISNLLKFDSETVITKIAFTTFTGKERILEQVPFTATEHETSPTYF